MGLWAAGLRVGFSSVGSQVGFWLEVLERVLIRVLVYTSQENPEEELGYARS